MPDDSDPPRKFYTMKAREIERLNPPAGQSPKGSEIKVEDHFKRIPDTHRRPVRATPSVAANAMPLAVPVPVPAPSAPRTTEAIVQANSLKEQAAGLNAIDFTQPSPPSRRKRDYLALMILGNGLLVGLVALTGFNLLSVTFGLSGVIIFSVSVTWVMWVLMDRY